MNLAIDIGNSRTKCALFDGDQLHSTVSYPDLPTEQDLKELSTEYTIDAAGLASVRNLDEAWVSWIRADLDPLIISPSVPLPIKIAYQTPETLGIDRICGAVAAHHHFPNDAVLIIDAGTCITYDLVDEHGVYLGGGISPGLQMRYEAMHRFTSRLPKVNQPDPLPELGVDTESSLQFGGLRGSIQEINGMIDYFKDKYGGVQGILTGGDAPTFEQHIENPIFAAPNLVLEGIQVILQYNQ